MATPQELIRAYAVSRDGEGNPIQDSPQDSDMNRVKTTAEYSEVSATSDPTMASASKVDKNLLPGQMIWAHGTTIRNPLRSDPRVEAVLGELKYKEQPRPQSMEGMRLQMAEMQAKMDMMAKVIAGGQQVNKEAKQEIVIPEPPEPDPNPADGEVNSAESKEESGITISRRGRKPRS